MIIIEQDIGKVLNLPANINETIKQLTEKEAKEKLENILGKSVDMKDFEIEFSIISRVKLKKK